MYGNHFNARAKRYLFTVSFCSSPAFIFTCHKLQLTFKVNMHLKVLPAPLNNTLTIHHTITGQL